MSALSETPGKSTLVFAGALLTTGQAAKVCAVDPRTIARWLDAGLLPSHRTVGGRRRMLHSDLLKFMRDHGMPVLVREPSPRPRIAVIDDDTKLVRALIRRVLRILPDADCRSAGDGFSAGALVSQFRPDLVFLDLVMPGMSGIDVCEHIRAAPELDKTTIVIVSGYLSDDLRTRLSAVGANRFISKPYSPSDIKSALADFLKSSSAGVGVDSMGNSV